MPKRRVALYARILDLNQEIRQELEELRRFAAGRGWQVAGEYIDRSAEPAMMRLELARLLLDARAHCLDGVLVAKLCRLAHSVTELWYVLDAFRVLNLEFTSYRDPGLDTTAPGGKMLFSVVSTVLHSDWS